MLKKFKLHNFRTFLNAELEFTQRHLLIGKNNSGKTNLCSALRFLAGTATGDFSTAVQLIPGGLNEIKNWYSMLSETSLECVCEFPYEKPYTFSYSLSFSPSPSTDPMHKGQMSLKVVSERLEISSPRTPSTILLESDGNKARLFDEQKAGQSNQIHYVELEPPADCTMLSRLYASDVYRRAVWFRTYLSRWAYYSLTPALMRTGCKMPSGVGAMLMPHGENLASVLYQMKNMHEERYRQVIDHVHIIEPSLEAVNSVIAPGQEPVPFVSLRKVLGASWEGLSDGTIRWLALATIIELTGAWYANIDGAPPLVIIEEPENGLYPGQLRKLFDLFEDRAPLGQFIFTSHSPYFINFFDGYRDAVTILRRNEDRTEVFKPAPPEDDPERLPLAEQYSMELIG